MRVNYYKDSALPENRVDVYYREQDAEIMGLMAFLETGQAIVGRKEQAVMLFIWVSGHFTQLHPNAYMDMFRSFTVPYGIAALVYYISLYMEVQKANQLLKQIKEDVRDENKK